MLAGQVLDSYNRRPPATYIQVSLAEDKGEPKGAPIEVAADSQGYFTIQGLQPGKHYQLTARAKDGERLLAGTTWAIPPNPKLLIRVSEDSASTHTPQPPPPPVYPGKPATPASTPPAPPPPAWPTPRRRSHHQRVCQGPALRQNAGPCRQPRDSERRSSRRTGHGHPRSHRTSSKASQWHATIFAFRSRRREQVRLRPRFHGSSTRSRLAAVRPDDRAFMRADGPPARQLRPNDLNGQTWEYRNRRGRLVLLDFWGSWCMPCQQAIPHLRMLQSQYGAHGLEIVGLAYENEAPRMEQIKRVDACVSGSMSTTASCSAKIGTVAQCGHSSR